jgi:hypothetical protein
LTAGVMLCGRFGTMAVILALAGGLAEQLFQRAGKTF